MINKVIKTTISAAVLFTIIQATPTYASPDESVVIESQIATTQSQIDDLQTKIQKLDNQIILAMEKSQQLNDQIETQQGKIETTESEIEKSQKDLDAHAAVFSERLKSLQLDGQQSVITYAEFLLSSDSFSEFFTRFTAISQIMSSDADLMDGLKEKQQELKDAEEELLKALEQLKKNEAELASEQKGIEEAKKTIESELKALQDMLQSQEAALDQVEAQEALQAQQEALQVQEVQQVEPAVQQQSQSSASVNTVSQPAPPADTTSSTNGNAANNVIAYAKQFLGVPYVWGGSTPNGFDCSGFVQYVYRNSVGMSLPRVSRDQQNVGTRISPSQVQPGDLVFNGSPAYHVGIYIGNGQYIHAPQTGDVVKIARYTPAKFSSAARILR
ncbi:Cell wall-associated hydrolase, NlpC family [Mesobacillus persicus]|uniref:Cell wall-associated hydrolase, NlpC family n=1 Tax=Mesobacillus persicus TaxID=930146 RepID=A0A1H8ID16_9BACI|nr:C40 family peptidase [Mesobacillus persicus]SEN66055.1 Cell wall-associated hydrolase, NlpC family [Mesobacillus persicus]